jgi:ATP-dependent Clp protease ATP-binding subunit ClpA
MNIALTVDTTAKEIILNRGYNPEYGARPLKRTISHDVEDLLSTAMIEGRLKSGAKIVLYGENGNIFFAPIN